MIHNLAKTLDLNFCWFWAVKGKLTWGVKNTPTPRLGFQNLSNWLNKLSLHVDKIEINLSPTKNLNTFLIPTSKKVGSCK